MNVDKLDIESTPRAISRRKVKTGMRALKKEDQKKINVLLWCFGGGGIAIGLIVFIVAIARGTFSSPKTDVAGQSDSAKPADTGKPAAKDSGDKKSAADKEKEKAKEEQKDTEVKNPPVRVRMATTAGNVQVMVNKPTQGPPPEGVDTKETDVLIVPVTLYLKDGAKKSVELKSWADDSLKKKVVLKDGQDQDKKYRFLTQVAKTDAATITEKWLTVQLVFKAPSEKTWKYLLLELPASAFQVDHVTMVFKIAPSDILAEAKSEKSEEGDSAEGAAAKEKKKPDKSKTADADSESK